MINETFKFIAQSSLPRSKIGGKRAPRALAERAGRIPNASLDASAINSRYFLMAIETVLAPLTAEGIICELSKVSSLCWMTLSCGLDCPHLWIVPVNNSLVRRWRVYQGSRKDRINSEYLPRVDLNITTGDDPRTDDTYWKWRRNREA